MAPLLRRVIIAGLIIFTLTPYVIPWDLLPISGVATATQLSFVVLAMLYGSLRSDISMPVRYLLNRYILALLILWMVLLAYLLISDNLPYGLSKTIWFFLKSILPLAGLAMLAPFNEKDLRLIFFIIILGSALIALGLLAFGDLSAARATLVDEEHPSWLARQIGLGAVCLSISVLAGASRGVIKNALSTVMVVLLVFAVALTGSRGPLLAIGFAVLGVFFVASFGIKHKLRMMWRLSVASLIFLLALAYSPVEFPRYASFDRINHYFATLGANSSDVVRIDRFQTALDGFVASHGVGVGTGSFATFYGVEGRDYPHNVLLETMVEQGLIGLLIVVVALSITLLRLVTLCKRSYTYSKWLLGIWLFSVFNAFVAGDIATNDLLWVTGGLAWLVPIPANKKAVKISTRVASVPKVAT